MAESQEPSYYEIALTHRQVLFGFVILLACLVVAFFSGVWMGRGTEGVQAAEAVEEAAQEATNSLPEVNFFSDKEASTLSNGAGSTTGPRTGPAAGSGAKPTANGKTPVQLSDEAKARRRARIRRRREEEARKAAEVQQAAADRQQEAPVASAKPPTATVTTPAPVPTPTAQPKPAAASSAAASNASSATQRFVIQVLSTRERAKAQNVVDRLKAAGYSTLMSTFEQDSLVMHRVRVGPFASRAEAERVRNTVQSQFKLDTWVTTE